MLREVAAAVVIASPFALCAPASRADDIGITTPTSVSTNVQCGNQATPECLGKLVVAQNGRSSSPPRTNAEPSGVAPAPPKCYYGAPLFTYTNASGAEEAVQSQVCPAGGEPVGTPLTIAPVTPPAAAVDIRALVNRASKAMAILAPQVALSPDADSTQYVGLPMWAWVPRTSWTVRTASVSAGGVSLTMTASPASSDWSMGDGGQMMCLGPGTPYPESGRGVPRSSPDCGYTYSRASSSQPDGTFRVTATTRWKVRWSTTTGLTGSEPDLTSSSSLQVTVSEIQALVTDVHP